MPWLHWSFVHNLPGRLPRVPEELGRKNDLECTLKLWGILSRKTFPTIEANKLLQKSRIKRIFRAFYDQNNYLQIWHIPSFRLSKTWHIWHRKLWWAYVIHARGQKYGAALGMIPAERQRSIMKPNPRLIEARPECNQAQELAVIPNLSSADKT